MRHIKIDNIIFNLHSIARIENLGVLPSIRGNAYWTEEEWGLYNERESFNYNKALFIANALKYAYPSLTIKSKHYKLSK